MAKGHFNGDIERVNETSYKNFGNIFLNDLNIYAPFKTKMLIFHNSPFITKKLRKEIIKSKFNKNGNRDNWCKCKTDRNQLQRESSQKIKKAILQETKVFGNL